MKIAVCYSGLYRTNKGWQGNHKNNIPDEADVYYSTWSSEKSIVDIKEMIYFDDPVPTYNCYQVPEFMNTYGAHLQNKQSEIKRLKTGYFQHLAHWKILETLPHDYDVVVRMRYDTMLGMGKKELYRLCQTCYTTGKSIGIGNTNSADDRNKMIHMMPLMPFVAPKPFLLDFMSIHKPESVANVQELVNNEQMWPTNAGWFQMLGENGYLNYRGGIQLWRYA